MNLFPSSDRDSMDSCRSNIVSWATYYMASLCRQFVSHLIKNLWQQFPFVSIVVVCVRKWCGSRALRQNMIAHWMAMRLDSLRQRKDIFRKICIFLCFYLILNVVQRRERTERKCARIFAYRSEHNFSFFVQLCDCIRSENRKLIFAVHKHIRFLHSCVRLHHFRCHKILFPIINDSVRNAVVGFIHS